MSTGTISRLAVNAAGLLFLATFGAALLLTSQDTAATHAGGMDAMSIDMDVTGNSATTLGPRDECIEVSPGDTVTLDVTAEGIPESTPMIAFSFYLDHTQWTEVAGRESGFLLASTKGSKLIDPSGPSQTQPEIIWVGSAADLSDGAIVPPEFGSGVLQRIDLQVDPATPDGAYPLTLSAAVHIDMLGEVRFPDQLNTAQLNVGVPCDSPPTSATPIPSMAPTPRAGVVRLGFDLDAGEPDINAGPAFAPTGGLATFDIVAEAPPGTLASWEVAFRLFEGAIVDCIPYPAGACDLVGVGGLVSGSADGGLQGPTSLARVTFKWPDWLHECFALSVDVVELKDPEGEALSSSLWYAVICPEGAATPAPTMTPVATPPVTPTPTASPPAPDGGMDAMSIDMDITGNTATSLGPRNECIEVSPGDTVTLDVTAEGIPESNPMIGFSFELNYTFGAVSVEQADAAYMLASQPGSSLFNISDPAPDGDGSWSANAADFSDWRVVPPEYGDGVLVRLKVRVLAEAPSGLHLLFLTNAGHADAQGLYGIPDAINHAYVAVNSGCDDLPAATPTPAPTPLATPIPPDPTPPLAPMDRMSIDLVTTGNAATSLGPREDCRTVSPGSLLSVDVTASNVPAVNPMLGFSFLLRYPAGAVVVQNADAAFLLASEDGSSLFDAVMDPTPDSDGEWRLEVADVSDFSVIPAESGSGVLARLELAIPDTASAGRYPLELLEAYQVDLENRGVPPNAVDNAVLAVGVPCPGSGTDTTALPIASSTSPAASPTPAALAAALPPTGSSAAGPQAPATALAALTAAAVASVALGVRLRRRA